LKEEQGGKVERLTKVEGAEFHLENKPAASPNTAHTFRSYAFALQDILLRRTSFMLGTLGEMEATMMMISPILLLMTMMLLMVAMVVALQMLLLSSPVVVFTEMVMEAMISIKKLIEK
ncbi:hypothetical protein KAW11_00090, partial [Candidatus Bathyarchaeota archaeon]|nr:hypothetical protein [Candidatus Bathyarchaeota archaeon]